ncbi:MAG: glycosyltransferase family 39 protein [Frankiaceae bacterium]|nr:glycosyltransferase family 39 protein [Frankiaceae bacterium]
MTLVASQRGPLADELRVIRRRDWAAVGIVAVVVAGAVLRFVSRGPLWLDEAQSVAIAKHSFAGLPAALKHDGAPPLYYGLLHVWMRVFGDSTFSVRALSGIPAVVALPVVVRLGRRIGGDAVGIASVVLLAISPFAVRYAVEARMYSLLMLLSLAGAHAVLSVHRHGTKRATAALALVTAAALYTHYYAVFAVAVLGAGELWLAWRRRDPAARRALLALVLGCVAFLPWVPILLYQSKHTGAPWAAPPDGSAVLDTIEAWMGGANTFAQIATLVALAAVVLALIGRRGGRGHVVLGTTFARLPTRLLAAAMGVLVIAIVVDAVGRQAYAPRYSAMGAALFLVVVACGIAVLPTRRARRLMLAVLVVADLTVCALNAWQPRSQAGLVAAVLDRQARPGDVIVYCPDQLGPQTARLTHTGVRQVVFPNFGSPAVVDWVDYRARIRDANAQRFARQVNAMAGTHKVWLVWSLQIKPLTNDCSGVIDNLVALRGIPKQPVRRDNAYNETMSLNEYGPPTD